MIMLASFFVHGGVLSMLIPLFAARVIHLGPAAIGGVLMLGTVWRFGAALVGARLAAWFGIRPVVLISLSMVAVTILGFHLVDSPLGLIAVVSLMSWAHVGGMLVVAMVTDLVPEPHWGTALGLNRTMGDIGAVIAPMLIGFVLDRQGFGAAFTMVTGVLLSAAVVAAWLTTPRRLYAPAT
jgi:predicted MFS family arabinose efflux permease